jgi:poly [ADP-ribose] polymerase
LPGPLSFINWQELRGHPLDRQYTTLRADLVPVEKSDAQYKLVQKMITNTHAPTHKEYSLELVDLLSVARQGENFVGVEGHPNTLLWHGSRQGNFAGIISEGLRIAPKEAPSTGFMFGKGIYFADLVTKSSNYCYPSRNKGATAEGYLLLCEVALGKRLEATAAEYFTAADIAARGCDSTFGIGATRPDPRHDVTTPEGAIAPSGLPVRAPEGKASSLLYNEYVVYNTTRVAMRYLVKVRFNYGTDRTSGW